MFQLASNVLKSCALFIAGLVFFSAPAVYAASPTPVMELLPPQKNMGIPLLEAFNLRQSGKNFTGQEPSKQDLSNILWAAFGANRPDGRRTVPTAMNAQDVIIYVALKTGVWQYDGLKHNLTLLQDTNLTPTLKAPMGLLYVAPKKAPGVAGMHIGSIYQNVALYCASAKLESRVLTNLVSRIVGNGIPIPDGYELYIVQKISTITP